MAQATSSRYAPYSVYLCISLLGMSLIASTQWHRRHVRSPSPLPSQLTAVLMTLVLGLHALGNVNAWMGATNCRIARSELKASLLLVNLAPYNPRFTSDSYPSRDQLYNEGNLLDRIGYVRPKLVRSHDARAIDGNPNQSRHSYSMYGRVEQSGYANAAKDALGLTGWAILPDQHRIADAVFLTHGNDGQEQVIFAVGSMERHVTTSPPETTIRSYVPPDGSPRFPLACFRPSRTTWTFTLGGST